MSSVLHRQHTGVAFDGAGLPFMNGRIGQLPARLEHTTFLFPGASGVPTTIVDADPGKPASSQRLGSGGTASAMTNGGVQIAGKASIPQAAATEINMSLSWTVFAAAQFMPSNQGGDKIWTLMSDYGFSGGSARHGFTVFAQQSGVVNAGAQIPLIVRMSFDGGLSFDAAYNMQLPPNTQWTFGKDILFVLSHDGQNNITLQAFASYQLVSSVTKEFDLTKGNGGGAGSKTNVTRWEFGSLEFDSPGVKLEACGVLQRQWSTEESLVAYRQIRLLARQRGRAWA